MPLPMVHLAVANAMCSLKDTIPDAGFLFGSIAPDAIYMRSDASREEQRAAHLAAPEIGIELERVRSLLRERWVEGWAIPFSEGFATHLLVDRLWQQRITSRFKSHMTSRGSGERELRDAYYRDCDSVDFYIYDNADWRGATWAALASVDPPDFGGIVTRDEVWAWRDRTLAWFEDHPEMREHKAVHITPAVVGDFISQVAGEVVGILDEWRAQ